MELTRLPFPFPGMIFRSAMPFSSYDPDGELISAYKNNNVSLIVILTSDSESRQVTGRDLRTSYETEGFEVLYLPIPDFNIPEMSALRAAVQEVLAHSKSGSGVAIHCHAGLGRTGMFAACLAKSGLNFSSEEAIHWVREVIPGAVEVRDQEQLVRDF